MSTEEKISYPSGDGIILSGVFDIAQKTDSFALMAHGINMDKNEWNNLHFRISKDLNEQNISTFRFDFRAHGESEGRKRDMTVVGEYLDIENSVKEVNRRWEKKISIIASSFGAPPSIIYTALFPEKVNCLILLNPVLDYDATFLNPIVEWGKETFNKEGYKYLERNGYILLDGEHELGAKLVAEFRIIKPFEFLENIKCPVLTIHGDKDSLVPYKISKKYGSPNRKSKFITIRNAEHGFVKSNDDEGVSEQSMKNQKRVTEYIIEWIKRWEVK